MSHDHASDANFSRNLGRTLVFGIGLNAAYVVIEATFGFYTGSLALLADAAHNLTDVGGLVLAWGAAALSRRQPSARNSYGFGRASILAAIANGVALLIAVGGLAWEAIGRIAMPAAVPGATVLWVALAGIVVNAASAMLFMRGREQDINIEGAYLHMAADAAVSGAVVLSALAMIATGWQAIDAIVGLGVSGVIAWSAFGLLCKALHLGLDGVPERIDPGAVEAFLLAQPGVASMHDLHIWSLSTTSVALTAHLVMPTAQGDRFLEAMAHDLEHQFGIAHATIQIERGDSGECRLAPADVI